MKHGGVHPAAASTAPTLEVAALLQALLAQPVPPLSWAQEMHLQRRVASRIDQRAAEAAERGARAARRPPLRGPATALAAVLAAVVLSEVVVLRARPPAPAAARVTALQGSVEIASGGATRSPPSLALVPLASEDELRTGEQATASASLATGATIEVGPSTRVRFTSTGAGQDRSDDVVALERGRVSVAVPPLAAGMTLSVRTPDTTITVHGTRFSVERLVGPAGEPAETRVSVVEGRVAVRHGAVERFVGRGETWSSRGAEPGVAPPAGDAQAPPRGAEPQAADRDQPARNEAAAGASSAPRDPPEAPADASLSARNH
ncbi:FecR domain-containing protein [Sorangium sp. So ce406]|uniref:FecR domain-containing protein n=1 Tax=Sorangium sp. So ce406 TaxID=3133311 RepID=UPI003F5C6E62